MPATFGIAGISIAGKARSYAARASCFVVPVCGDGGWLLFPPLKGRVRVGMGLLMLGWPSPHPPPGLPLERGGA
jgi:hypothetical protein